MNRKVYTLQFLSNNNNGHMSHYQLEVYSNKKRLKERVANFINTNAESGGDIKKYKIGNATYIDWYWNNKLNRFIIETTELK